MNRALDRLDTNTAGGLKTRLDAINTVTAQADDRPQQAPGSAEVTAINEP